MSHRNFQQEVADNLERIGRERGLTPEQIRQGLEPFWKRVADDEAKRARRRQFVGAAGGAVVGGLPGALVGSQAAVPAPRPPPVLPVDSIPDRDDPEVLAARKRQMEMDRRRKGRRATILTGGRGVEDELGTVNRPQARRAELLG